MTRLILVACLIVATLGARPAQAQWSGQVFGSYNATAPTLTNGQLLPLQIDNNGNLKVDCVVGCGSASGTASTVTQGSPAAPGNAWPFYLAEGGSAVGAGNPLYVQDPNDGAPISGIALPAGGSGMIGWMSSVYKELAGTINVTATVSGTVATADAADGASPATGAANQGQGLLGWLGTIATELAGTLTIRPAGVTGAPTVGAGTLSASAAVLAAEANGVTRLHMKVWNFAQAGGGSLYCTDDGSTPTATNASFIVYAQGGYERDAPAWVPSTAITCVAASGSIAYRAESFP